MPVQMSHHHSRSGAQMLAEGGLFAEADRPGGRIPAPGADGDVPAPPDVLLVSLGGLGVAVVVSAAGLARSLDMLARRAGGGHSPRVCDDPALQRLAHDLDTAEWSDGAIDHIYADALRRAIVARALGMHDVCGPAAEPEPAPRTAILPEPEQEAGRRRSRSALPKWRFKRVAAYIEANLEGTVSLAGMAEAAGLSRMHFAAQFRALTGLRPHEYLLRRRIERAQAMMLESRESLVEIALAVGFQTQAHFTTVFRRFVGDTPNQWRCANRLQARGRAPGVAPLSTP